ncbi:MAG TPA: hypothetical protein VNU21_15765, partial [Usitatibacter sp.]|nr:hypothetical protein [Usitatibacter sp.]
IVLLGMAVSVSILACIAFLWREEIDPMSARPAPMERAPESAQPAYDGDSAAITSQPSGSRAKWM